MALSLHPLLVQDAPCPHCYGFHISNDLSKHVKSAHLHASFVSQASQAASLLQVSSFPMLPSSFIPFVFKVGFGFNLVSFWGCLRFVL
jgi:hypothetical protein